MPVELRFIRGFREGEQVTLDFGEEIILGRSTKCTFPLADPALSRKHCVVTCDPSLQVADLASKNGTFVNGKRIKRKVLGDGDQIIIGSNVIEISMDAATGDAPCGVCGTLVPRGPEAVSVEGVLFCDACAEAIGDQPVIPGYTLHEKLGEGNLGTVFRAEQLKDGNECALKILHRHLVSNARDVKRFFREAKSASKLDHPGLIQVYESGQTDKDCFIAMEFVEGESVAARIEREGKLDIEEAIEIVTHVAGALEVAIQSDIVHRDIKPENILLPEGGIPKVVDFGLAKSVRSSGASRLTQIGEGLGTLAYLPPEQLDDAIHADHRSDLYSLGATLFHMICGRPPFVESSPRAYFAKILTATPPSASEFNPEIPSELDWVLAQCLEKKREDRFQNSGELRDSLLLIKKTL